MIVYVNRKDGLYSFLKNYNHDGINALEELKKEYKAYKESGRHSDRFHLLFSNRNVTVIDDCMNWTETGNYNFWDAIDNVIRRHLRDMVNDITEIDLLYTNTTISEEEYL